MLENCLLTLAVLAGPVIGIVFLHSRGRSRARNHGFYLLALTALSAVVLGWMRWQLPGLRPSSFEPMLARTGTAAVVALGLIAIPERYPERSKELGRLALSTWELGLGVLWSAHAVFSLFTDGGSTMGICMAFAGVAMVIDGTMRRRKAVAGRQQRDPVGF